MATAASGGSALGKDSLEKIGKHLVANSKTNQELQLCRLGAVKISVIEPLLSKHGIKLVAIGLERLGVEDFVERKFFPDSVEIYIDEKKLCYQDLGFKRFTLLNVFKALVSAVTRRSIMEARKRKIEGNMQGDGLQNGGLLIVKKGGTEILLYHKEEYPGDHAENDVILKALGISETTVASKEESEKMAKMEEEGLNCDKLCSGGDTETAPPAQVSGKKKFVAKKKTT